MGIPKWFLYTFGYEISSLPTDKRAEFTDIRHGEEISAYFKRQGCLKAVIHFRRRYPVSRSTVEQFPTTWQVESGFSVVARMMTKQRNRLFITTSGDLRLATLDQPTAEI